MLWRWGWCKETQVQKVSDPCLSRTELDRDTATAKQEQSFIERKED
jgi:hypothetical protein